MAVEESSPWKKRKNMEGKYSSGVGQVPCDIHVEGGSLDPFLCSQIGVERLSS
jgi:hypothetical protein